MKWMKENKVFVLLMMIYLGLLLIQPSLGVQALQNSQYYIKEMILIMPVIFILTALLDTWVEKEAIYKYLGKEAKTKGMLLAFIVGSISAGPIYAAFPICKMLYKKGASVSNIVIILSSWAVVKIPMLINEVKFLGFRFMILRWFLTIIAIMILAYCVQHFVPQLDITEQEQGLQLNRSACMGCTLCTKHCPSVFTMEHKKAKIIEASTYSSQELVEVINACPVKAITFQE